MPLIRPSAVFLDRDGTITDAATARLQPDQLRLLPGAADAIRLLNAVRLPVVVVSNEPGIGRGEYGEVDYAIIRQRLHILLADHNARVDGSYHCPHDPSVNGACECRTPNIALFRAAADDLAIDLRRAWYIGDRWRDVAPSLTLGGRGVLIPSSQTPPDELGGAAAACDVAESLGDVVTQILRRL